MEEIEIEPHINTLHLKLSELQHAITTMSRREKAIANREIRHYKRRIELFEKLRADAEDAGTNDVVT